MIDAKNRFEKAVELFDQANALDPNIETIQGKAFPRELLYAQRMTDKLKDFEPNADESVLLAARCQHLERWKINRDQYEMDRNGYLKWRNDLKSFHASRAGNILEIAGYQPDIIEEVQSILLKKKLKRNARAQLLEDVVCLVFLEYYFETFAKKHDKQKLIDILRKTWAKMSDKGREEALNIANNSVEKELIMEALGS